MLLSVIVNSDNWTVLTLRRYKSKYFIVRLKFQKRSALKFVSRTIPPSGGYNTPQLAAELFPKLALGFIPVIVQCSLFFELFLCALLSEWESQIPRPCQSRQVVDWRDCPDNLWLQDSSTSNIVSVPHGFACGIIRLANPTTLRLWYLSLIKVLVSLFLLRFNEPWFCDT